MPRLSIRRPLLLASGSLLFGLLSACSDSNSAPTTPAQPIKQALAIPEPQNAQPKHEIGSLNKIPDVSETQPQDLKPAPNFKSFAAGSQRKEAFFNYMEPLIHQANDVILKKRAKLQATTNHFKISENDQAWLKKEADLYGLDDFDPLNNQHQQALEQRIDIIAVSLALAQGANESAWGTSRFARKANNYFGQWCFTSGCGLVPKQRSAGATHEVRSFAHPYNSVQSYIHNLNSHRTYQKLRDIRYKARQKNQFPSGEQMAKGLVNYSARKGEYVSELQQMIRYNKLSRFDQPTEKDS